MPSSIQVENSLLHYEVMGTGPKSLLVFHGFGQQKETLFELAKGFSSDYTLYLFDLFFHGESKWNYGEQPIEKVFWNTIVHEFLKKHQITSFCVLGFSLGGKFALATLEGFPTQVKEIFLLAPDGIKISPWYWLATYPTVVRKLFKSMITKPGRFQRIANAAHKIGLINGGMLRFVESQMNTEKKRAQVYFSWVVFRHLKFNMKSIASIINSKKIALTLVIGKHDRIITPGDMQKLLKHVHTYNLVTPETGHTGILTMPVTYLPQ